MTKKKIKQQTNAQIAEKVEVEGCLCYTIMHYMGSEDFEDEYLAELWDRAADVLHEIEELLDDARAQAEEEGDDE